MMLNGGFSSSSFYFALAALVTLDGANVSGGVPDAKNGQLYLQGGGADGCLYLLAI